MPYATKAAAALTLASLLKSFAQAQLAADKENLDIVGIFHTHPDHPPRPSKTDESQPMLAGWINVIASCSRGNLGEAKAWWREDDKTPFTGNARLQNM